MTFQMPPSLMPWLVKFDRFKNVDTAMWQWAVSPMSWCQVMSDIRVLRDVGLRYGHRCMRYNSKIQSRYWTFIINKQKSQSFCEFLRWRRYPSAGDSLFEMTNISLLRTLAEMLSRLQSPGNTIHNSQSFPFFIDNSRSHSIHSEFELALHSLQSMPDFGGNVKNVSTQREAREGPIKSHERNLFLTFWHQMDHWYRDIGLFRERGRGERASGYQPGPGGPGSFVIPGVKHKYATGLQIHHETVWFKILRWCKISGNDHTRVLSKTAFVSSH